MPKIHAPSNAEYSPQSAGVARAVDQGTEVLMVDSIPNLERDALERALEEGWKIKGLDD